MASDYFLEGSPHQHTGRGAMRKVWRSCRIEEAENGIQEAKVLTCMGQSSWEKEPHGGRC